MPKLDIDLFDEEPKVGNKVRVTGKVESINEDTGMVEVSYDDVKIVDPKKRKKRRDNDDDDFIDEDETVIVQNETQPNMQTYDQALASAFPNTQ